jgi:hypothetical protein
MAEANHSISQIQARIITGSFVLAMQRARGAVKEELKRQRVRIADVEAKEITEQRGTISSRIRNWSRRQGQSLRVGLHAEYSASGHRRSS